MGVASDVTRKESPRTSRRKEPSFWLRISERKERSLQHERSSREATKEKDENMSQHVWSA